MRSMFLATLFKYRCQYICENTNFLRRETNIFKSILKHQFHSTCRVNVDNISNKLSCILYFKIYIFVSNYIYFCYVFKQSEVSFFFKLIIMYCIANSKIHSFLIKSQQNKAHNLCYQNKCKLNYKLWLLGQENKHFFRRSGMGVIFVFYLQVSNVPHKPHVIVLFMLLFCKHDSNIVLVCKLR